MPELEWRGLTPEEFGKELAELIRAHKEQKYSFQVGLKDVDLDVDQDKVNTLGMSIPFKGIDQAEYALRAGAITPTVLIENDDTEHKVVIFDPEPVGYSGFMDCVTHSLVITDHGLFEVGYYPAVSLSNQNRDWQWFLHRQLATSEEVATWQENGLSPTQIVDICFELMTGRTRQR